MKVTILVGARVEADIDCLVGFYRTPEQYAKRLEDAVQEFHAFIRDHRSMDNVRLNVVLEHEEQCSHCGYIWEVDENGTPGCCQEAVDEHEAIVSGLEVSND